MKMMEQMWLNPNEKFMITLQFTIYNLIESNCEKNHSNVHIKYIIYIFGLFFSCLH